MTRVGIIGLGFMGMVHYLSYRKIPHVKVVAICDRKAHRLDGDWAGIQGNFGPPGEQLDLSGVATYESWQDLLADPDVDLVDVTLPPAAHTEVVMEALQAGKHVFCEKPMALNTQHCDLMMAASEATGKKLLIGHVLPFMPEYAWALQEIRSNKHGKLLGASLKRVISDPAWLRHYWNAEMVGGPMLDLHVHDAHFLRLAFGMPTAVTTRGSQRNELPEHWHSLFDFKEKGVAVHSIGGVVNQPGRPFLHGFEIRLERATLVFEFAVLRNAEGIDEGRYLCPPTLLDNEGQAQVVELGDGDPMQAFFNELQHVDQVLRGDSEPDILSCQLARDAIAICQMESASLLQNS